MLTALIISFALGGLEPQLSDKAPRVFGPDEFGWRSGPRVRLVGDVIPRGVIYSAFVECRVETEGRLTDCTATDANPISFARPLISGLRHARIRETSDGPQPGDRVAFEYRVRF